MKRPSDLGRLLSYAGRHRILTWLSWVLSAVSALVALVPFWYIWRILQEVIAVAPQYDQAVDIGRYGWLAVAFAVAAVLFYIAGLMCAHLSAFHIATRLRIAMLEHIAALPLGRIGQFGSGKTTLASLVARFFDPQEGSVRIGGVDVRDIAQAELMDTVAFVSQDSHLLKGTIRDNVRLGRPDASDEAVLAALREAQCMDILGKSPAGLDTVIGSQGVHLSGGEGQRLSIARAFLKDAPVVLLDEATAFADPDNEAKVQAAFDRLARGRTVLIIAHRLSTVANADRIFVLRDGMLAESGSAEALLAQDGLFRSMWQEYQRSVQWKVTKEVPV